MQKGLAPIVIVLILAGGIALVGGGYYLGTKRSETFQERLSRQNPVISPSINDETVYTESGRSANWKTYTNVNYKVSFKYPNNYLIVEESIGTEGNNDTWIYDVFFARTETEKKEVSDCLKELECYSYPFAVRFQSLPKPSGKSLGDVIWINSHDKAANFSPVKVDGLDALQQQISGVNNSTVYHVYVDRNQTAFHIQVDTNKVLEKNASIIISTFKFIQ